MFFLHKNFLLIFCLFSFSMSVAMQLQEKKEEKSLYEYENKVVIPIWFGLPEAFFIINKLHDRCYVLRALSTKNPYWNRVSQQGSLTVKEVKML